VLKGSGVLSEPFFFFIYFIMWNNKNDFYENNLINISLGSNALCSGYGLFCERVQKGQE
jgi:hypothetical protein